MGVLDFLTGVSETLLDTYGTDVKIVRTTRTYDPLTGRVSDSNDAEVTVKGRPDVFEASEVDGEVVRSGDVRITVAGDALSNDPAVGDRVEVDSDTYELVRIVRTLATDDVAIYELHCRR